MKGKGKWMLSPLGWRDTGDLYRSKLQRQGTLVEGVWTKEATGQRKHGLVEV